MSERLLPRSEVERLVGLRRSAIYDRMAAGTFPAPVQEPGTRNVRWLASEVEAWTEAAYRRGDLLDRRRELMQAWADYLSTPPAA